MSAEKSRRERAIEALMTEHGVTRRTNPLVGLWLDAIAAYEGELADDLDSITQAAMESGWTLMSSTVQQAEKMREALQTTLDVR